MTEDDARQKWCPFSRVVAGEWMIEGKVSVSMGAPTYNRMGTGLPDTALCIASRCACWRWSDAGTSGYCGLAGAMS